MRRRAIFVVIGLLTASLAMPPSHAVPLPRARILYSVYNPGDAPGRLGLYFRRPGRPGRRLTRGPGDFRSQWSPDRRHIAYVSVGEDTWLYVMDADGSNRRRFARSGAFDWSPDSSAIVYLGTPFGESDDGLYVGTLGGDHTRLHDRGSDPDWSPDGERIAFTDSSVVRTGPGEPAVLNADIFTIATNGDDMQQVSTNESADFDPVWSPDSERIAFRTYRHDADSNEGPYSTEIYVIGADGTDETRMTEDCHWEDHVSWLPDGSHLIYSTNDDDDFCVDPQDNELRLLDVQTRQSVNLTRDRAGQEHPSLSPNGRWVAFLQHPVKRRSRPELAILRLSDGFRRVLTSNDRYEAEPNWST